MNPNTLDPHTLEVFETILRKSLNELTDNDVMFLQARRDYLNHQQKDTYKEVLERTIIIPSPESVEEIEEVEESKDDEDKTPYRELQKKATALNIKSVGVSREELERAIETAQGAAGDNQPE